MDAGYQRFPVVFRHLHTAASMLELTLQRACVVAQAGEDSLAYARGAKRESIFWPILPKSAMGGTQFQHHGEGTSEGVRSPTRAPSGQQQAVGQDSPPAHPPSEAQGARNAMMEEVRFLVWVGSL